MTEETSREYLDRLEREANDAFEKAHQKAIGRRCGPVDGEDDFRDLLKGGYEWRYWPQGAPEDRKGMVSIFHPAVPHNEISGIAERLAKDHGRDAYVAKERDARWIYVFLHDPFRGCGVDDGAACLYAKEKCELCAQWFDTDWYYVVRPDGTSQMLGVS